MVPAPLMERTGLAGGVLNSQLKSSAFGVAGTAGLGVSGPADLLVPNTVITSDFVESDRLGEFCKLCRHSTNTSLCG